MTVGTLGVVVVFGYVRASTDGQSLTAQRAALTAEGIEYFWEEVASGSGLDRPVLRALLSRAEDGDVICAAAADRLVRSVPDALVLFSLARRKGVIFRSAWEKVDTTAPQGRLTFFMLVAHAQYERALLRARTQAGVEAARAQGRVGGRKPKLTLGQEKELVDMLAAGRTPADIGRHFGVHRGTVRRIASRWGVDAH